MGVGEGVPVADPVPVSLPLGGAPRLRDGVGDGVAVGEGAPVPLPVPVPLGVGVPVAVPEGEEVGVAVGVGVGVGVRVGSEVASGEAAAGREALAVVVACTDAEAAAEELPPAEGVAAALLHE